MKRPPKDTERARAVAEAAGLKPDLEPARALLKGGMHLVRLHAFSKRPVGLAWNDSSNFVTEIDDAATGYGIPLAANKLASVDPDHAEFARKGLAALGLDLEAVMAAGTRSASTRPNSGGRSAFKAADGLEWLTFAVTIAGRSITALELRATASNLQDVVPGLVYTPDDESAAYTQTYTNGHTHLKAPPLPAELLELWRRWSSDHEAFLAAQRIFAEACGADPVLSHCTGKKLPFPSHWRQVFNERTEVAHLLEDHGYTQDEKTGRYSPPNPTGLPGVRLIPCKKGLWQSDHQSDPLRGTFDAWAANVILRHGGNVASAEEEQAMLYDVPHPNPFGAVGATDDAGTGAGTPEAVKAPLGLIQTVRQVLEMGSGVALVRNVIYAGTFVLFAGKWKAGKSFLTLDMVLALSRGLEEWFGHETIGRRCRVLYINAEGSLSLRLRAYLKKHNLTHADIDSHFFAVTKRLKLNMQGGKALLQIMEQHEAEHGKFDIVVVDTVARALEGNENSPEDMGAFVDACEHLIGDSQRALIAVHHLGKDESRGSRGHSSLPAAVAGQIDIERNDSTGIRSWAVAFQRDSEEVPAQSFRLEQVGLGVDPTSRRGECLSSVVVTPCEAAPVRQGDPGGQPGTALRYLREMVNEAGGPVPFEAWRVKCYDSKLGAGDADGQRQAFNRAKSALVKAERISISGEMVMLLEITSVTSEA